MESQIQWGELLSSVLEVAKILAFLSFVLLCLCASIGLALEKHLLEHFFRKTFGFHPRQSGNSNEWERLSIKSSLKALTEQTLESEFPRPMVSARFQKVIRLKEALISVVYFGYFTTRELEDLGASWGYGWNWLVSIAPETFRIYHKVIKKSLSKKESIF